MAAGFKTGGRKRGVRNKSTLFRQQLAAEGYKNALEQGVMPLEVVFRVMRGGPEAEAITDRQFEAARAALPYCHPRLNATFVGSAYKGVMMSFEERLAILGADPEDEPRHLVDGTAVVVERSAQEED